MLESSNSRSKAVFFPQLNIPSLHFVYCAHSLEILYKFNHTCKFKDVKKSYTSKAINYNLILNLNLHFLSLLDRRENNIKTNFMLLANKIHQHTGETGVLCVDCAGGIRFESSHRIIAEKRWGCEKIEHDPIMKWKCLVLARCATHKLAYISVGKARCWRCRKNERDTFFLLICCLHSFLELYEKYFSNWIWY